MNLADVFRFDDSGCYWVTFHTQGFRQVTDAADVLAIAAALKAQGERMHARTLRQIAGKE